MASLTVRKNVDALTAPELQALRAAYKNAQQIMDNRGYNYYAGLHGIPNWYCWHHEGWHPRDPHEHGPHEHGPTSAGTTRASRATRSPTTCSCPGTAPISSILRRLYEIRALQTLKLVSRGGIGRRRVPT